MTEDLVALAAELAEAWHEYWELRALPAASLVEVRDEIDTRGRMCVRRGLLLVEALQDDQVSLNAALTLVGIGDALLILSALAASEEELVRGRWQLGARDVMEQFVRATGVGEWCRRHRSPLRDSTAHELGVPSGELPAFGPLWAMQVATAAGVLEADAEEDARVDAGLRKAVSMAWATSRELLACRATGTAFEAALLRRAGREGVMLLRVGSIAGAHAMRRLASSSTEEVAADTEQLLRRIGMIGFVANCLIAVGSAQDPEEASALILFDANDLAVSGGGGRRIPARSGRATVPRTDVPSSRAFILSTLREPIGFAEPTGSARSAEAAGEVKASGRARITGRRAEKGSIAAM